MSFFRLDPRDVVISSEAVAAPVWSTDVTVLTTFHTSSAQMVLDSADFYGEVRATTTTTDPVEFSIAYADATGGGAALYNTGVAGVSPTSTVYRQIQNLVLGGKDDTDVFNFDGTSSDHFFVVSFDRARYHEKLLPGTFNLHLQESGGATLELTDNSKDVTSETYTDAGRVYQIVSGSNGSAISGGGTTSAGSYGWILPDVGILIFNGAALSLPLVDGGMALNIVRTNTDAKNYKKLFQLIKDAGFFAINSEETITSNYVFARVRSEDGNYSTNPTMISGSSGDLFHDEMVYSPATYVTTVGIYNDNNDLLAVAKMSKPLKKDFTKEALIRIKLDY